MEDKGLAALIACITGAIGLALGIYITRPIAAASNSPQKIESARKDLNGDKITDYYVIKNNGARVPMLSMPQGSNIMWVSPKEYTGLNSHTQTARDYQKGYEGITEP